MRHKKTAAVLSLVGLSALLAACDAITAQHIPSSTTTAFNNGAGLGGRGAQMGMPGSFADGGGLGGMIDSVVDEAFDADVIGRIAEVDGNTVKLDLLKQGSSSAGSGAHSPGGAADGQTGWTSTGESLTLTLSSEVRISTGSSAGSGDSGRFDEAGGRGPGGAGRGESGRSSSGGGAPSSGLPSDPSTGDSIAGGGTPSSADSGGSAAGSAPNADVSPTAPADGSVSDLKSGQVVMVWYKEGSKTVDRIRVLRAAGE